MGKKYALIIGNSKYKDKALAQLSTPDVDVRELARVLRDPNVGGFDSVEELVNQPENKVRRSIGSFFTKKGQDDLLLLYFSGHGVLDAFRGQLFLAVKDTEYHLLRSTAIPARFITEYMDESRSQRQILILDCCNSGAFERAKGEAVAVTEATFEGNGRGRVVLTASSATQAALEGDQVIAQTELSLFTHYLLQGLTSGLADKDGDGKITIQEWYNFAYENVLSQTPNQTPFIWEYKQQGELVIAKNPFPKPKALNHSSLLFTQEKTSENNITWVENQNEFVIIFNEDKNVVDNQKARIIKSLESSLTQGLKTYHNSTYTDTSSAVRNQLYETLKQLGETLYDVIFSGEIIPAFNAAYERIRAIPDSGFQIVLEFRPEALELAKIPWELIFYKDWLFNKIHITRRISPTVQYLSSLLPSKLPLRILILAPRFKDLDRYSDRYDETGLKEFITGKLSSSKIEVHLSDQPTLRSVIEELREFQPHVLHYMGYGVYDYQGVGIALFKEDCDDLIEESARTWIRDSSLEDLFKEIQPPLFVIQALQPNSDESYYAFRALASKLAYSLACGVLTIQYPIRPLDSEYFFSRFYDSISMGKSIGLAFQEGRTALIRMFPHYEGSSIGSPVVYLPDSYPLIIKPSQEINIVPPNTTQPSKSSPG